MKPGFLWLGEEHAEALATLNYGIQEDMGFLLLTGDVGVGKTVLIRRLIGNLTSTTAVAHITDPDLSPMDFFKIVASEFRIDAQVSEKAEFLIAFKAFLQRAHKEEKKVLLIIDEAQRLKNDMLDQIRVFSNIERGDRKLINIFFVGQPEFKDMLLTERNRALRQRIAVNYHINPLTEAEVGKYIEHRLKRAGRKKKIFEDDAIHEIFTFTGGFPRAINIICDHALMTGYSYGLKTINGDIIKECKNELRIREDENPVREDIKPVRAIVQEPVAVRLPKTIAPPPEKKPLFPVRSYPLLIGICALLSVLLIILLMRPDDSETTQVIPADESRDVSSMNTGTSEADRLQSFPKDSVPPLANDEWRQEEKMEIERALTPPKETDVQDRFDAGSQGVANASAVGDEDLVEKSDSLLPMRHLPSPPVDEIRTSPRVSDENVVTSSVNGEEVSSNSTSAPADRVTEKGKSEEPVIIPNKSIEAMAVMSAALATKGEAASKPAVKTSPLVGNRPSVSTSSASKEASEKASTKQRQPESPQVKKSNTTTVASPSKPAKKTATKRTTNAAGAVVDGGVAAASAVVSKTQPKAVAITTPSIKAKPTATAPAIAQADILQKAGSNSSEASRKTNDKTDLAGLDNRIRWFLKSYCITYAPKGPGRVHQIFRSRRPGKRKTLRKPRAEIQEKFRADRNHPIPHRHARFYL